MDQSDIILECNEDNRNSGSSLVKSEIEDIEEDEID